MTGQDTHANTTPHATRFVMARRYDVAIQDVRAMDRHTAFAMATGVSCCRSRCGRTIPQAHTTTHHEDAASARGNKPLGCELALCALRAVCRLRQFGSIEVCGSTAGACYCDVQGYH